MRNHSGCKLAISALVGAGRHSLSEAIALYDQCLTRADTNEEWSAEQMRGYLIENGVACSRMGIRTRIGVLALGKAAERGCLVLALAGKRNLLQAGYWCLVLQVEPYDCHVLTPSDYLVRELGIKGLLATMSGLYVVSDEPLAGKHSPREALAAISWR